MSDPDNFLTRWSRKKIEEKRESVDVRTPEAQSTLAGQRDENKNAATAGDRATKSATPTPAFDLASLPSIDSIGPQTDVSVFMQPGVPSDLRHAALRRAWSVDPGIRDFRGLQENDWDFNDPYGVPGFGPIGPDVDVRKMVADLFGEKPADDAGKAAEAAQQVAQLPDKSGETGDRTMAPEQSATSPTSKALPAAEPERAISHAASDEDNFVQREGNSAVQDKDAEKTQPKVGTARRSHGGALPQ